MKKAFVAILSLAALVACSQDVTVKRNDSAAIGFDNAFVENKTRAAADPSKTTATLEEFAVWGFYNDPDGSENFLVFDNEVVTKTTEGWSYKNLQYWMKGFDYFFGAVYPVNHKDVTVDTRTMSEDGLGKISFTNTDGSVDLLYAFEDVYNGEINVSAPEKVRFLFAHLLSRVKFSFKYNFPNELTTVAVENIKINNSPAEGSIDVTKARANWSWDITQNSKNVVLDFGHVNGAEQFAELDTPYESDKYCLMIPTDESRPLNITFDVVFYQDGKRAYVYPKEANLAKTFVQGKSYNIVAEITPKELELQPIVFDVIEVLDWDVENDVLISPEDSDQPGDDNDDPEAFEPVASEWGVVGDLTNWGSSSDIVMYTTPTENLFVAEKVEIKSGAFKIRANGKWDDAKNYGFEVAGKAYADKYYAVITGSGSQNITPIEYGVYDVYFDLAQKRVALMTPGKAYAEAEDGGAPVVVIEGLKDHEWGLVGSFNNWDVANYVVTTVEGDWAVAKNIALAKNAEFKFAADKAWTLSYGTACDVKVGETYQAKNNAGNMKYVGEAGNFDFYFSLVDAKFYMTVAGAEAPAEPVALATPVVETSVEGNVVTLNWADVENAAQYSITVGTETPVFVEETTYVFTGEYETEYTFNVVAVPADEEKFATSEAAVVTVTTEAAPVVGPTYTTVAEFLAAEVDDTTFYTLKGTITRVANTSYGNFDLTDETGTIYVYGLNSEDGATDKYWGDSGAKLGDDIVISAVRTVFNGSAQAGSARFMGLTSPGTLAFWSFSKTATTFTSVGGQEVITVDAYNTTENISVVSDNEQFTATYADGALTITAEENATTEPINGNITVTTGALKQVITVTQGGVTVGGTEVTAEAAMKDFGWANSAAVTEAKIDDNVTVKFFQGGASTAPAYYTSGEAVRLYQNGAYMTVSANGKTIKSMEIKFGSNMYYVAADSGELTEEATTRTWTGDATEVKITCTGTDKNHRAYIAAIKVTYVD